MPAMATGGQAGIWICSRTAPTYAGGLAVYQLGLQRVLSGTVQARFVAIEAGHAGQKLVREIPPDTVLLGIVAREFP